MTSFQLTLQVVQILKKKAAIFFDIIQFNPINLVLLYKKCFLFGLNLVLQLQLIAFTRFNRQNILKQIIIFTLQLIRWGLIKSLLLLTPIPTPDKYNLRNGSCNSVKLVTLLCNGNEPKQRTGKLQLGSSFATSVNIRAICSWTLLLTHSTPNSIMFDAVVVVVVVVRVIFIGLPRGYKRVDDRVELTVPLPAKAVPLILPRVLPLVLPRVLPPLLRLIAVLLPWILLPRFDVGKPGRGFRIRVDFSARLAIDLEEKINMAIIKESRAAVSFLVEK